MLTDFTKIILPDLKNKALEMTKVCWLLIELLLTLINYAKEPFA